MADWTIFPFGKYEMKHFNEIRDLKYLTWYINKLNNEQQIKHCAEAIILEINRRQKERQ